MPLTWFSMGWPWFWNRLNIGLMKWIIYSLLLVNLAFGLWHYRSQQVRYVEEQDPEEGLRLVLLDEYLNHQGQVSPKQDEAAQNVARCYTLGPFKTKSAATSVTTELDTLGISAKRRISKDNKRKGYWVLIPPAQSRKAANQSIAELKQQNIKDYFLVVTGEKTNAVSLGVFSRPELAQKRYDMIKQKGFDAKIDRVDLPVREYWLDWPIDQQLLPQVLDKIRREHPDVGKAERPC